MIYEYGDNLSFVKEREPDVFMEYVYAERNAHGHPYVALNRLRIIYEWYANCTLDELNIPYRRSLPFHERIKLLRGRIPSDLWNRIEEIRPICNSAAHEPLSLEMRRSSKINSIAMDGLELARDFAYWFYQKVKRDQLIHSVGFIAPPPTSFEEELRYAHDGDGYAALAVAKRHLFLPAEEDSPSFHKRLGNVFLDISCSAGIPEARFMKARLLIYLGESEEAIKEGLTINEELIREGEIIGTYCDKACGFSSIGSKKTAVAIARKGVEMGDPYAMNLLVQWSGYPDRGIFMGDQECIELLEQSLEIVFNAEAAYYLSMFYESESRVWEAIDVLEKALRYDDSRRLIGFRLGSILIGLDENSERGYELIDSYARESGWSSLNAAEKMAGSGNFGYALKLFKQSLCSTYDKEIQLHIDDYRAVRDALISHNEATEKDLFFLINCLGDE